MGRLRTDPTLHKNRRHLGISKISTRVKNASSLLFVVMQQQSNKLELFIDRLCSTTSTIGIEQQGHVFLCNRCTFKKKQITFMQSKYFLIMLFCNLIWLTCAPSHFSQRIYFLFAQSSDSVNWTNCNYHFCILLVR
jgi:hypothetical protein